MSSRLIRIDAQLFRSDSVRFEACPTFRSGTEPELCECGWLEADHTAAVAVARRHFRGLRPRRRQPVAVPRAS